MQNPYLKRSTKRPRPLGGGGAAEGGGGAAAGGHPTNPYQRSSSSQRPAAAPAAARGLSQQQQQPQPYQPGRPPSSSSHSQSSADHGNHHQNPAYCYAGHETGSSSAIDTNNNSEYSMPAFPYSQASAASSSCKTTKGGNHNCGPNNNNNNKKNNCGEEGIDGGSFGPRNCRRGGSGGTRPSSPGPTFAAAGAAAAAASGANGAASSMVASTAAASNKSAGHDEFQSFGDEDIDWDAAAKILDQVDSNNNRGGGGGGVNGVSSSNASSQQQQQQQTRSCYQHQQNCGFSTNNGTVAMASMVGGGAASAARGDGSCTTANVAVQASSSVAGGKLTGGASSVAASSAGSGNPADSMNLRPNMLPRPFTAHGRKPQTQMHQQRPPRPNAATGATAASSPDRRQHPSVLDRPSPWNNRKRPPSGHSITGSASKKKLPPSSPQSALANNTSGKRPPASPLQAPASIAAANLQGSLPPQLKFESSRLEPVQDDVRQDLVRHAELSKPLANGWTLYGHQKKAVLRGLLMRRTVAALDMGTGKTLTACVWARAFHRTYAGGLTVIVVCPVSLKEEWKRTAEQATELAVQTGSTLECVNNGNGNQRPVFIASWGKVPESVPGDGPYVVIADEAHNMQAMTAARTKNVLKLVEPPRSPSGSGRCVGVLLLTGTPMKNGKPGNLFPLLRAVQHPLAYVAGGSQRQQAQQQKAFEEYFCNGRFQHIGRGRQVWQAHGAAHLDELRQLTMSHILYLKKDDVLKDLPPRTREFHHVPVSSRLQMQHQKALKDLQYVFTNSSTSDNANKNDAILGAVQKVRMVGSLAKVDATVQLAKQILERESSIVIFSSFVQVCKQMTQKLQDSGWPCELLTGETPAKKRQVSVSCKLSQISMPKLLAMVDKFQSGLSSVFCCTFGAGGVGLTLTAACTVILLDRPWTPGEADQAEDRVRRIGQTKPVKSIWMSAFDLDKQIDQILEQKKQTAAAVLDENSNGTSNMGGEPQKLSIFQLLRAIIPTSAAGNSNASSTSQDGMKQTSLLQFSQSLSQQHSSS